MVMVMNRQSLTDYFLKSYTYFFTHFDVVYGIFGGFKMRI